MTTPYTYLIGWTNLETYYYGRRTAQGCHPQDLWSDYFTSSNTVHQFVIDHGEPDLIQVRQVYDSDLPLEHRISQCVCWENKFLEKVNAASNPKFLNKSNGDAKFDSTGMVSVVDLSTNNFKQVNKLEFELNSHKYKSIRKGMVAGIVIASGQSTLISAQEFSSNRHLYRHHSDGLIKVVDKRTGSKVVISTIQFHSNRESYIHHSEGKQLSETHIQRIKDTHTGVPKSDSHKQNISKSLTGYEKTQEHINKIHKNRNKPFKPVVVNGMLFESVTGAAAHFGVNHSAISNFLAGRKRLSARFWEVRYA